MKPGGDDGSIHRRGVATRRSELVPRPVTRRVAGPELRTAALPRFSLEAGIAYGGCGI